MPVFCRNVTHKDPAVRGPLMIIDQVVVSTCNDAADFTSEMFFANILLSNVTVKVSDISNYDIKYGNIKLQKTKKLILKPCASIGTFTLTSTRRL